MGVHWEGAKQVSKAQLASNAMVFAGLAVTAVSLVIPFASNEDDCLDHCADAHSYFIWHPLHNIGAPFSLIGAVASVALWRSTRWRRRVITWVGSFCGWIGVVLLYDYAAAVIREMYLYGGPAVDMSNTTWIVFVGWTMLWIGALISSPQPDPRATTPPEHRPVRQGGEDLI